MPLVLSGSNGISSNGINVGLTFDNAGRVQQPNKVMFWAYRSGSGNVAGETDLSCDVATVNVGNCYNTSTFRFTAPVTGTYMLIYHCMNNQTNPGASVCYFKVNGSGFHYFHIVNSHPSSSMSTIMYNLNAGDYVNWTASNIHWNGGSIYKYPYVSGWLM